MDPNANFDGQQQPYQYQQQDQQQHPQTAGTHHNGYIQQAYAGQPMVQQNNAQPMNQPPMQQFGAPPQAQNIPSQQQPTYQSYQQAIVPAGTPTPVAGSWNQQMQYSQVTPSLQAQTATNSATTTTTTTTTKKFTKLKQALQGRKEPSVAPSKPDFSSLLQQSPQQQQQQQQQTAIDFSQLLQSPPPAQPQPQPAIDFSVLLQSAPPPPPPTQQKIDFSQLLQGAPPPPPLPTQQKIDFSQLLQAAPQPSSATQGTSNSTNAQTTTTTSTTETVGSASRRQAATQGAANLRQFDQNVSIKLNRMLAGTCPMGFDFYAVREGYLCGGGNHFVEHAEVEAMLKYNRRPRLEFVNINRFARAVTPPPGNGDGSGREPAFWTVEQQLHAGAFPFAALKDPKVNPRLNGRGWRR
jgi:hypothetical protein